MFKTYHCRQPSSVHSTTIRAKNERHARERYRIHLCVPRLMAGTIIAESVESPQVQSTTPPVYARDILKTALSADDQIIEQAKQILASRLAQGPAMSRPQTVKDYLTVTAPALAREEVRVLWLNSQHQLIKVETLAVGTINGATVYPREVVQAALAAEAAACIITHNHPSGNLDASTADKQLTDMLTQALGTVEIRLLDHIITAGGKAASMAERGEM